MKNNKIFKFLLNNKFVFILVAIWLLICVANFTPNTYLTGWDNLHHEFDYNMNLKRLFTSSWAEYQGLGAPGAHSHAADIPRLLIIGVLNLFLPQNLIRYVFIFGTLLIGVLGIYFLVKNIFLRRKDKNLKEFSAFAAALFYMLNVGTVQHFVAPFEMFSVQYALLPWLVYLVIKFLDSRKYKYLLSFAIVTFFAAPMAYAVMLWIAYVGALTIFLLVNFLLNRKRDLIKPSLLILSVTIGVNLFWLVPNLYFVFNHSNYVPTAKTNLIFSEEAFLTNQKYGNPVDIFLNKGFLFDWQIRNTNYTFESILGNWDKHMDNPLVLFIALVCFALIVTGILYSIYKKQKYLISIVGVLVFSAVIIMGTNPPFGGLWELIVSRIPALQEAIRFPFTKFSILFIFAQTILLSAGFYVLANYLSKKVHFQFSYSFSIVFILLISLIYSFPTFQGSFINKSLRINIPQDYFQTFDFFKNQDKSTRIANFPVNTLFGWFYTDWGYQGSGFLWYGIEQPILDRDFDRWYTTLENYYDEVSSAVYTNDANALKDVLTKYAIDWVLIDEHVSSSSEDGNFSFNPNLASSELAYKETKALLDQIPEVQEVEVFGKIHIYKVSGLNKDNNFVEVLSNDSNGQPIEQKSIFLEDNFGRKTKESYFEKANSDFATYFNNIYTLSNESVNVTIPQIYNVETSIPVVINARKINNTVNVRLTYQIPSVVLNNKNIFNETRVRNLSFNIKGTSENFYLNLFDQTIRLNELNSVWKTFETLNLPLDKDLPFKLYSIDEGEDITSRLDLSKAEINNCSGRSISRSSSASSADNGINFRSTGENICIDFNLNTLGSVNSLYLLNMEYRSNQGVIGDACIKINDVCVNSKSVRSDYIPTFWYPFSTYATDSSSNRIKVSLVFNNGIPENTASLSYRNIKFDRYEMVGSTTLSNEEVKKDLRIENTTVSVTPEETKLSAKFNLPINKKYNLDYAELQKIISLTPKDCKPYVDAIKLDRSFDPTNKQIVFKSIDGFNCENINLYNLNLKNGFMITLEGENVSGPGLVLNVSDFFYKKVYYTNRLPENKIFSEFVTIPNLIDSLANGLNIFVNNQSVGKGETINTIKSINVTPIIYNWLSNIKVNSIEKYSNDQSVLSVNKLTTTNYRIEVAPSVAERVLKFNQSYEANWLAYDSKGNLLKRLGDQNINTEKAEWNNFWILPAGVTGVFIEYRTQTYQYIAYVTVLLIFIGLIMVSVNQSTRVGLWSEKLSRKVRKIVRKFDLLVERRLEPKVDKYKKFNKKDL